MKLFVNTVTKECGMYNPSDLDNRNWIEAPKGTQAVYWSKLSNKPVFYKTKKGIVYVYRSHYKTWSISPSSLGKLTANIYIAHLWGTLPDFEF